MQKLAFAVFFVLSSAQAGTPLQSLITSKSCGFKTVSHSRFDKAWKMTTPNKEEVIWSDVFLGYFPELDVVMDYEEVIASSTDACTGVGGVLPSIQQYQMLQDCFDTDLNSVITEKGKTELYKIFPAMKNRWFVANQPSGTRTPTFFNGFQGTNLPFAKDTGMVVSVQCVNAAPTK